MRIGKIALAAVTLACIASCAKNEAAPATTDASPDVAIDDLSDDFVAFWDATKDAPMSDRVAKFKTDVAAKFPQFYDADKGGDAAAQEKFDQSVAKEIEAFGEIRDAYLVKAEGFRGALGANIASFRKTFPDFDLGAVPLYLVHSLGQMDGGTRNYAGTVHLIFGVDGMVRYHQWEDEPAFFHHELFHIHHQRAFTECNEVWCLLWVEGLAVYAAGSLNPEASEAQLLLNFPEGLIANVEAKRAGAFAQLESAMTSADAKITAGLFQPKDDGSGLPGRRGYYLGLLVARELASERSLDELARMSNEEARPLIFAAVQKLAAIDAAGGEATPPP